MKTITLQEPGRFTIDDTPIPERVRDGDAMIRIRRVGICGTDLHAYRGRQPFFTYPRILGHELGVEIVEIGSNERGLKAGDLCSVEPYLNCGHCIACRQGKTNCCTSLKCLGVHTDGGMRDYLVVPASKLHKSDVLSLDQLALVETLGIGAHAVDRSQLTKGEFALVIGAGPIGLSVMQFALAAGANVIVQDISEHRLRFCREQMGLQNIITSGPDAADQLLKLTDGELPTTVFDATGNAASMMSSFGSVSHGGRLVFVGLFTGDVTFHDPDFHRREMTLLASRNSTPTDFERIISLLESRTIDTTPWITHEASSTEMIERFDGWLNPDSGVIKALINFDD